MAFSLFGKRKPDSEIDDGDGLAAASAVAGEVAPARRGFFDRMQQAVTRTRDSFSESIGSVLALTREIDETSLAELEAVLLAADIGGADGEDDHREPAAARAAAGDRGRRGAEAAAEDGAEGGAGWGGDGRR